MYRFAVHAMLFLGNHALVPVLLNQMCLFEEQKRNHENIFKKYSNFRFENLLVRKPIFWYIYLIEEEQSLSLPHTRIYQHEVVSSDPLNSTFVQCKPNDRN